MTQTGEPLTVFGPRGLERLLDVVLDASSTHLTYPLHVHEVGPGGGPVVDEDDGTTIDAVPLVHRVESFAWWIREADRPGAFDVDAARALGVPEGPAFGRLQRGERIRFDDGSCVEPAQVVGPTRSGRRVVIAGDNSAPDALFERTDGADVAVHEATYTERVLARIGDDHGHSTAARVAAAAARHGVRNLVLTHFSPRYQDVHGASTIRGDEVADRTVDTIEDVRAEALEHFDGGLHLARDFDRIDISDDGSTIR